MFKNFFTYKGRIGRKTYLITTLAITVLGVACTFMTIIGISVGISHRFELLLIPPALILVWTVMWILSSFPSVKRLHDIGVSGWFFLLTLSTPIYFVFHQIYWKHIKHLYVETSLIGLSVFILLILLFKKGTQ